MMSITSKRSLTVMAAAIALSFGGAASAKNPNVGGAAMYSNKTIVANAANSKDHTTLVAAVKAAGLVETLSGAGPFTVFAPTDEAFAKLPAGTVDALLADIPKLTAILTYHVVAGKVMAADVMKMDGKEAATVNGAHIKISTTNGVKLNAASTVVKTDIECTNGVIHVIDTVIMPPSA